MTSWPSRAHCKDCSICRFALHNIRKIRPFLTEHAAQLLVQALVISSWTSIKHNQTSTNDLECSGTTGLQRAQKSPCYTSLVSLHWLPVAARIQFKTLMLAYRTTTGSAPTYFHSLLRIYIPSRRLRSASERRLVVPSQRNSKSLSRTFSFTVPGRWNDLPPPPSGMLDPCQFSSNTETHLFQLYLTTLKKKKNWTFTFSNLHLSLYLSLLPLLACTYLNNAWDLVLLALPLYVCLFKINRFMYSQL